MIRRREFITLLGGVAVAWPLVARAQQAGKVWHIGMLETITPQANAANFDALRKGLRELGYIEGQNLVIEYRSADGRAESFPALAADLVRLNVDVIVTRGTPSALAAWNATKTIPIVMASIGNAIGTGLAANLARPGGNVTGLTAINNDTEAKRLELLRGGAGRRSDGSHLQYGEPHLCAALEAGRTRRAGAGPRMPTSRRTKAGGHRARIHHRDGSKGRCAAHDDRRAHAAQSTMILELAAKHRLPAIYPTREFVENGGLMAYGVSYPDLYRRAATYIDRILKGANPAALPIEQPTKFELAINLKTAKALGLEIPPTLLARADEVIE